MTGDPSPTQMHPRRRWPVGLATLAGLVIGAVAGALAGSLPVGTAAGTGLGVAVDSVIHYLAERR